MNIKILHLYPDLLNLYGDKGNIEALRHRLLWRGIDVEVVECRAEDEVDLSDIDIVFLGGGSDKEEQLVCTKLCRYAEALRNYVEDGGCLVAVCGGYPMLGKQENGLGVLDIYTESTDKRFTGNVVLDSDLVDMKIVGFENHASRTTTGDYAPLGIRDNGEAEGIIYKNVLATYLHGPLFPKNPQLCDYVLANALKRKYADFEGLSELDDTAEITANEFISIRNSEFGIRN